MPVDTPEGLIVPVIKGADTKSLLDIGMDLKNLAHKARQRKVTPSELKGSCITLSNLGGIGGNFFTPIINWPEVAILGVGRDTTMPKWMDGSWQPRNILPIVLAYDHRVIDGADAARFVGATDRTS